MKKLLSLICLLISLPFFSQNCNNPYQFCTGTAYNYPLTTGGTSAPAGINYGCLFSQPNPTFFYFQISNPGNLTLNVAGSAGGDVDAICWGPFTADTNFCTQLMGSGSGSIVDCSYSISATETINISNAVTGQYYVLMVTNFSNMAQNLILNQTGGLANTNCDTTIVPNCNAYTTAAMCFVNTNNTPNNELYFNHTSSNFQGTIVYRKNALNTWDSIGYVPSTQSDEFVDLTATPNQQDYTYCVSQLDSCGNIHSKSPAHTTILLQSSIGTSGQINLSWNAYIGISVPSYYIYRGSSPLSMSLLAQVSSTTYAYTDLTPLSGTNYYKIEIQAPTNCTSNATHDTLIGSNYRTNNNTASINYLSNVTGFNMYPNPAQKNVTIYSSEMFESIEIADVLGNTVLVIKSHDNTETISLQNLNRGVYFVRISNSNFCRKLLIE